MTAETLADLFTRERRSSRPALEDATGRTYDTHWLCTSTWKAGNFLRHTGVRKGVSVGVVGDGPMALLAFFGTGLLEGSTQFDPAHDISASDKLRTLVAPVDTLEAYDLPPGAQRVGYGGSPSGTDVHHFDAGLWSENPSFPPLEIDPDTTLLTDGSETTSHRAVLEAAHDVIDTFELETETRVEVRAPLSDPRVVTAGVVAPLLAGGVIVLASGETTASEIVVSVEPAETERHIDPQTLELATY